jgi:hypothetical protein
MSTANIKRRETIERVYPPDAFASDAAQNRQTTNQVRLGVRILSAPNAAGDFELERSNQHVGEAASPTFLAPHRKERGVSSEQPGLQPAIAPSDPRDEYADFLAEIVTAAEQFGFEPEKSPGPNEPRLQGLRQ